MNLTLNIHILQLENLQFDEVQHTIFKSWTDQPEGMEIHCHSFQTAICVVSFRYIGRKQCSHTMCVRPQQCQAVAASKRCEMVISMA